MILLPERWHGIPVPSLAGAYALAQHSRFYPPNTKTRRLIN